MHDLISEQFQGQVRYGLAVTIEVPRANCYRPKLVWHAFEPIELSPPKLGVVYIFKRMTPPVSLDPAASR